MKRSALSALCGMKTSRFGKVEMTEEEKARAFMQPMLGMINSTPAILLLLYDADMMPEQTVTMAGARRVAAVVSAYIHGFQAGQEGSEE